MTVSRAVKHASAQVELDAAHHGQGRVRRADLPDTAPGRTAHDRHRALVRHTAVPCGAADPGGPVRPAGRSAVIGTRSPYVFAAYAAPSRSSSSVSGVSGNGAVRKPQLHRGETSVKLGSSGSPGGGGERAAVADDRRPRRPVRALSATASPTSISSWPSAKVGYRGDFVGPAGEDVAVDGPEQRVERIAETLDVAARQSLPPRLRWCSSAPGTAAGTRWAGRGGHPKLLGVLRVPCTAATSRPPRTGGSSCGPG